MPKLGSRLPAYRLHKATNQAVVTLSKRDYYLGPFGSVESRVKYNELISNYLLQKPLPSKSLPLTIEQLCTLYLAYAAEYYSTDSTEPESYRYSAAKLVAYCGTLPAVDFGPLTLQAFRNTLIANNLCRNTINRTINRIKKIVNWGASQELFSVTVHNSLCNVLALRRGFSKARDTSPVEPADDALVAKTLPFCNPQVATMIQLQQLCGMRPGEVVRMTGQIDQSLPVWRYHPSKHKTQNLGKIRTVYIGEKAQELLTPWLRSDPTEFLFQPREAEQVRRSLAHQARKTPLGNRKVRHKRTPKRRPGSHYSVHSYRKAIRTAQVKANFSPEQYFYPHQIRHLYATNVRDVFDLETASILCGHSSLKATEVYAKQRQSKALAAVAKMG